MTTTTTNTIETAAGTLTWWHHGWLEYALRLETPTGTHEAVEDSWFAALAVVAREVPDLPVPAATPAENAEEHRRQWVRWVADTLV